MSEQQNEPTPTFSDPTELSVGPLVPSDPPRVGPYWLRARLVASSSGVAYTADDESGTEVVLVRLSEGAAGDAAARDRFAGLVGKLHIDTVIARGGQGQDDGRWPKKFVPEQGLLAHDDLPESPWVALERTHSEPDRTLADHLLSEVELRHLGAQGTPSGPTYRHYWLNRAKPGLTKLWPLPWPGQHRRAGWVSLLISWLLTALLLLLAMLFVWLLFKDMPPQPPPEPVPTTGSAEGSPSPQSGSPSPQSGSPSPGSASPSVSEGSASASASASPSPSGTESGGGQQSPRSRL